MENPKRTKKFGFQKYILFIISDVEKFVAFNGMIIFHIRAKLGRYQQKIGGWGGSRPLITPRMDCVTLHRPPFTPPLTIH